MSAAPARTAYGCVVCAEVAESVRDAPVTPPTRSRPRHHPHACGMPSCGRRSRHASERAARRGRSFAVAASVYGPSSSSSSSRRRMSRRSGRPTQQQQRAAHPPSGGACRYTSATPDGDAMLAGSS
ncbi:hypothetical protein GUJ93_ZPchr0004g38168 [Zizania palustris]|uniref:Uncharacterized protein n=1 Tax=Zizania palustris TaxID=103762 RepID=A0A8J5SPU3_ZIZPA|nr:hypothetical protein GUJ93_ZPchr0004g38168 [Zizania palustris]